MYTFAKKNSFHTFPCTLARPRSIILCPNLIPILLAPVIQIYELLFATICYNLQLSCYTSHIHAYKHTDGNIYLPIYMCGMFSALRESAASVKQKQTPVIWCVLLPSAECFQGFYAQQTHKHACAHTKIQLCYIRHYVDMHLLCLVRRFRENNLTGGGCGLEATSSFRIYKTI